jgi:hypothetical protein
LKPSPGNFFVSSMPSLLPMAISLMAWSSTSAGSRECGLKMLSRCGSVLAQSGAHAPPGASVSAPLTETGAREDGFDEGVETDTPGRVRCHFICRIAHQFSSERFHPS